MDNTILAVGLVALFGGPAIILGFFLWVRTSFPKTKNSGDWVAEVWIDWEICAGSTMYRQRFKTKFGAYIATRARAIGLDLVLPRVYWDTDWSGKPVQLAHEYSIRYGVRVLSEMERKSFNTVYSLALPGEKGSAAEHSSYRLAVLDSLQLEENGVIG